MGIDDDLNNSTVKELLVIAKRHSIAGRHKMKKQELISAILNAGYIKLVNFLNDNGKSKTDYVANAKIGTIIAFKVNDKKALSGMIEEIHKEGFVVKTKNGIKFNVLKQKVMWVKTGARWPKGVYNALKGEQVSGYQTVGN